MESGNSVTESGSGKRPLNSPALPGKRLKQSCLPFKVINSSSSSSSVNSPAQNKERDRAKSGVSPKSALSSKKNDLSVFEFGGGSSKSVGKEDSKENKLPKLIQELCGPLIPKVVLKKYFASTTSTVVTLDSTDDEAKVDSDDRVLKDVVASDNATKTRGPDSATTTDDSTTSPKPEVVLNEADTTTDLSPSKAETSNSLNSSAVSKNLETSFLSDVDKSFNMDTSDHISEAIESAINLDSSKDCQQLSGDASATATPSQPRKKKLTKRRSDPSTQLEKERLAQEKIKVLLEKERLKAELRRLKDESRRQRDVEKAERVEKKAQEEKLKLEKLQQKDDEKKKKQEALATKLDEKQQKDQERSEKEAERAKLEEEKRKAEDEEKQKRDKAKAAFANFFVKRAHPAKPVVESARTANQGTTVSSGAPMPFLPFQVKKDVKLAPLHRNPDSNSPQLVHRVDAFLKAEADVTLYLDQLKLRTRQPAATRRTWPSDDVEVMVVDGADPVKRRCRLLQFCDNVRPAYFGTWSKRSKVIGPRTPFNKDSAVLDYEVDSDDEWEEEEEVGESLSNSEGEKESEDDYEVDNEFFVPHGYLSDEEAQDEEHMKLSPDRFKARLELKEEEFQKEMKKKCHQVKPRVVGCVWIGDESLGVDKLAKALEQYSAVLLFAGQADTCLSQSSEAVPSGDSKAESSADFASPTETSRRSGPSKKNAELMEKVMPSFIKLVHGSTYGKKTLFKEFRGFVSRLTDDEATTTPTSQQSSTTEAVETADSPAAAATAKPFLSVMKLSKTLQQIASYGRFAEPGPIFNEMAWCVSPEVRRKYGLEHLPVPNSWQFTVAVPAVARSAAVPEQVAAPATSVPAVPAEQKRRLPKDFFVKKRKHVKVVAAAAAADKAAIPQVPAEDAVKSVHDIVELSD